MAPVLDYSFIVPVYNRPEEMQELLESLSRLSFDRKFELVVVEDGSEHTSEVVCDRFRESVTISYYNKPNTGPGDSRNHGMRRASGNYFIILDSDCLIPPDYLEKVDRSLTKDYVDCYGGPDAADASFTRLQRAINYSMTSTLTTGGIRGGGEGTGKFQPRSFNMGISRKAFEATGGFGHIHPGEDPDLTLRLWDAGYDTKLIPEAMVYHKRRISWSSFYRQVNKFGKVRVILNRWHPGSGKFTYWFPTLFTLGLSFSIVLFFTPLWVLSLPMIFYLLLVVAHSSSKSGLWVGFMSLFAVLVQFIGYGMGFFISWWKMHILGKDPEDAFPELFFNS